MVNPGIFKKFIYFKDIFHVFDKNHCRDIIIPRMPAMLCCNDEKITDRPVLFHFHQ